MTAGRTGQAAVRRVLLSVCIVLWIAAFTVSHIPADRMPEMPTSPTSLHVIGFFVLGTALLATLTGYRMRTWRRVVIAAVILACYAAIDEATQPFFNRYGTLEDWQADLLGAAIAIVVWEGGRVLVKLLRRRTA